MLSIDLHGPGGNAYNVMGQVKNILKQLRVPKEDIDAYLKEAMSSDYDNLLEVSRNILDKHHIDHNLYVDEDEDDEDDYWDDDDDY